LSIDAYVPHQHRQKRLSTIERGLKVSVVAHQLIGRSRIDFRSSKRIGADQIAVASTLAHVVQLKISRGLVKAKGVEPVVNEVDPIEKIGGRRVAGVERRMAGSQIDFEVEIAVCVCFGSVSTGESWVEKDLSVVALGAVCRDPACRRDCGVTFEGN